MPKEIVPPSTPNECFQAVVGWEREHDVRLGIQHVGSRSLFWQCAVGDPQSSDEVAVRLAALGEDLSKALNIDHTSMPSREDYALLASTVLNSLDVAAGAPDSIWAALNRKGINDLIRALRRARDQAYGRDE